MHHVTVLCIGYYRYDVFRTEVCVKSYQTLLPPVGGAAGDETTLPPSLLIWRGHIHERYIIRKEYACIRMYMRVNGSQWMGLRYTMHLCRLASLLHVTIKATLHFMLLDLYCRIELLQKYNIQLRSYLASFFQTATTKILIKVCERSSQGCVSLL